MVESFALKGDNYKYAPESKNKTIFSKIRETGPG
jgi:hypothetical protein